MTDLEKAVSKWLGWKPHHCRLEGRHWHGPNAVEYQGPHSFPCPPATPELGFRLLEAMRQNRVDYSLHTMDGKVNCVLFTHDGSVSSLYVEDELTAITKAAAALADKEFS